MRFYKDIRSIIQKMERKLILRLIATISIVGISSCQSSTNSTQKASPNDHRDGKTPLKSIDTTKKKTTKTDTIKPIKKVVVPKAETTYKEPAPVMDYGVMPYYEPTISPITPNEE